MYEERDEGPHLPSMGSGNLLNRTFHPHGLPGHCSSTAHSQAYGQFRLLSRLSAVYLRGLDLRCKMYPADHEQDAVEVHKERQSSRSRFQQT